MLHSRTLVVLTSPLIYLMVIPFALDLFITTYQAICFPVYGVPRVARTDYIGFDRGHLAHLNVLERFNCFYCSYANGLIACVREIAARTEQSCCPIRHAQRLRSPHSCYPHFLDYGDAGTYSRQIEMVRCDFADVKRPAAAAPLDTVASPELGHHHRFERRLISDQHARTFGGDQHLGPQFGQGPGDGLACHSDHLGDLFMGQGSN